MQILLLTLVSAAEWLSGAEPVKPPTAPPPAPGAVQFTAPKTRAIGLKRQVNAGSRSGGAKVAVPIALAPDGLGLCTAEQPVFWWFLSQATTNKVEFTLNRGFETLLKLELPDAKRAGLHAVNLAALSRENSVLLAAGSPYEWTVRVKQGEDPATDPVTIGWVEYRPVESGLQAKVAATGAAQLPALYAAEGYWYDTVNLLTAPKLRPELPLLLRQVGLTEVMATDH